MIIALLYFFAFVMVNNYSKSTIRYYRNRRQFETIACFILLFFVFGFRDLPILNDTAHYYEHFQNVMSEGVMSYSTLSNYDIDDRFSAGYLIYERLIGVLFGHPYMIICVSALIISISFVYFARTHTTRISLFLFMCVTTFLMNIYSGLRQGLAICIFLFAMIALEKKRIILYYALVILAFSFHSSAIILFIVPLLERIKINKTIIVLFIIVTIIFATNISSFVVGRAEFADYSEINNERKSLPIGSILNTFVPFLMILFSYRIKQRYSVKMDERSRLYWWLSLLTLFFGLLDTQFAIMGRFCLYFNVFVYTLFLYYIGQIKYVHSRKLITFFVIFCLMLRMIIILSVRPEWYHIDNYAFYDFTQKVHETRLGY